MLLVVVLPVPIQTMYAELLELLLALDARRSIGHAPGAFVTKTLKRGTYYYFQYSEPGGTTRQAYVGRKTPALDALVARYSTERDALRGDRATLEALASSLRAGGAHPVRFALHKLLVAQRRPVAFQAKSRKDVGQAAQMIRALEELRPGEVRTAAARLRRSTAWRTALERGLAMLARVDDHAAAVLRRTA